MDEKSEIILKKLKEELDTEDVTLLASEQRLIEGARPHRIAVQQRCDQSFSLSLAATRQRSYYSRAS